MKKLISASWKSRYRLFPIVFVLVLTPLFIGFAGSDRLGGWGTVPRLVGNLLTLPAASAQDENGPYSAYQEALGVLKREYDGAAIDSKKSQDLTIAAIRGMLFSLNDPFTSYLDREEWASMQQDTRGDFEGIGAYLEPYGPEVRVVRPIPGSPAFAAGVKSKDIIISVGEIDQHTGRLIRTVPTSGKYIDDVVKLIKGPQGTRVAISVVRKGAPKPLSFVLTRAHIEPPIVTSWMEDSQNKIGHVLLSGFNEKSDEQFTKALKDLEHQGMRGLVFDLRYNPGGLLTVAVDIASHFVQSGPVVIIQEKNGQREPLDAHENSFKVGSYPVVVLINENSASASEIVSGALQDHGLATLVGEHTFGKGLVQTLFPLDDDSALRLTTAKYFTPSGRDINNRYDDEHRPIPNTGGVKPDVEVKQSDAWVDQDFEDKKDDAQLTRALDILRGRIASAKTAVAH